MTENIVSGKMPVLALRGLTVFPDQTVHFDVGRQKSVLALDAAMKADQTIFLVPQRDIMDNDPPLEGLYQIGTVAKVKQVLKSQGDNLRILVTGLCRGRIKDLQQNDPYMEGYIESVPETEVMDNIKHRVLRREANALYAGYCELTEHPAQNIMLRMIATENSGFLADTIAQHSGIDFRDKAKLLCQMNPVRRLEQTVKLLRQEVEMLKLDAEIQEKTRANIDQNQRDYYMREQIRVLREELGEGDDEAEFAEFEKKIRSLHLDEASEKKLLKDLERMKKQPFGSAEAGVLRNYIDTVLELPWNVKTKERVDVAAARKILDHDHYGLQKVKERILESIAVRQMAPQMPPQILCLVGPPGVGKTSIAYSIARSLNRKMARISLGGVRDEADIRGHRKTYVGAMPGRIISGIIQAGSSNPILLLDEIDKMGSDHRGDPSAAMLEVLDSEQNGTYRDHYLEIPFNLGDVMFITTANTLDTVPRPLLDRMEVIELGSYTDEEKVMIAKNHLIPKQLEKHGLKKSQVRITDDGIREIISCYTRESGVRTLERRFAEIARKSAMAILEQETPKRITVTPSNVEGFLGVRVFLPEKCDTYDQVGVVTGLAWTAVGGTTLEVEVNILPAPGISELTGNLSTVMKESCTAAMSYIISHHEEFGIPADFTTKNSVHVHFPEAAIPKDGPSAGIAICTAIVSAITGRPVRHDVAMTGEISIRGRVLPIGGLKEKTMAALRHGCTTVIIPKDNERDLEEIDQTVRSALKFVTATTIETVLETALAPKPQTDAPVLTEIPEDVQSKTRVPALHQ